MPSADDIARALRGLSRKRLLIGIPREKDPRPGEPIGNAALAYIHNLGSPARNIPPRPHLMPGVEAALPEIQNRLRMAAQVALAGNEAAIDQHLGEAGELGVRSVRRAIQAGIPPPLRPETVARRRRRTPGSSYRRRATTAADTTPLIDTAALLRAYSWVIRTER